MIEGRDIHELPGFATIVDLTTEMANENRSIEAILRNLELMNSKYSIFDGAKLDADYFDK